MADLYRIILLNWIQSEPGVQADLAEFWQCNFQDSATPVMEGIINFHHDLMFFLVIIVISVLYVVIRCVQLFNEQVNVTPQKFVHGTLVEIIWTITPAFILLLISIPSFALLYSMDEIIDPIITLKVIGHQWYWSYEHTDGDCNVEYDSYIVSENDLYIGQNRLLEVDNRVVLPENVHIRVIVTASDVLHCWAVPSLGIKIDACPGRLNQTSLFLKRKGVFYGQCSEICGINHGFMPIVIDSVSLDEYLFWIQEKQV